MASESPRIYQPIHPSVRAKLDPQYAAFHDSHLQYIQPSESFTWDPEVRNKPGMPNYGSPSVEVGSVRDIDLSDYRMRAFTPLGAAPTGGWPVCIWFHGGGWTIGDISSENNFCTILCKRASCVLVTVDYRLAPENPFPAAVDDAVSALQWIFTTGKHELGINPSRIAVGGSSAGANLSVVLTLKAALLEPPIPLIFQLLTVPVIDNTATAETAWYANRNAPWLTPTRMTWYRNMYLPNEADSKTWVASPNLAPLELISKSPPSWIGVSEQDMLATEGIAYGEQLKEAGVSVKVNVYAGSTHSILSLDGMCSVSPPQSVSTEKWLKLRFRYSRPWERTRGGCFGGTGCRIFDVCRDIMRHRECSLSEGVSTNPGRVIVCIGSLNSQLRMMKEKP